MNRISHILDRVEQGDSHAAEELLPLVYDHLRKLAAHHMARQPPGHTLQPTALVHEAWLKLAANSPRLWNDRKHFFSTAADAMRQILIDRARKKRTQRHGGGQKQVEFELANLPGPVADEKLMELNEALEQLAAVDAAKAEIVKLKFFAGLTDREVAELLGVTERTIERAWAYARVWLFDKMNRKELPRDSAKRKSD